MNWFKSVKIMSMVTQGKMSTHINLVINIGPKEFWKYIFWIYDNPHYELKMDTNLFPKMTEDINHVNKDMKMVINEIQSIRDLWERIPKPSITVFLRIEYDDHNGSSELITIHE